MPAEPCATSISTSLSSSLPSRSILRKRCRVELTSPASPAGTPGSSASRIRSSAASSARVRTLCISCSRVFFTAISTRSRMMESTSRPT